jgi:hypothetical protein
MGEEGAAFAEALRHGDAAPGDVDARAAVEARVAFWARLAGALEDVVDARAEAEAWVRLEDADGGRTRFWAWEPVGEALVTTTDPRLTRPAPASAHRESL